MSTWTANLVQRVTAGHWLTPPTQGDEPTVLGFSIDSRTLRKGQAYVALKGARHDGHEYLDAAAGAGATLLIVDHHSRAATLEGSAVPVLLVDQCLRALTDLARYHRQQLRRAGVKVVAVTGSNGKTTTRHLIHSLLSTCLRGTQSPRSFNNHIGVPLTLLASSTRDQFVVAEVGTNHPGEIATLADIVRPDVAVLTCVGQAHLEHFGSRANVAREKADLLRAVVRGGAAIFPGDEPLLADLTLADEVEAIRFGRGDACQMVMTRANTDAEGVDFSVQYITEEDPFGDWQTHDLEFRLNLAGVHNALNATAALAVARWLGLDLKADPIGETLATLAPVEMRLNIRTLGAGAGGITLINDAYNANPDSMAAAIGVLRDCHPPLPQGRRVAILGDMLELGDLGPDLHRQLGQQLAALTSPRVDLLIVVGRLALFIAEGAAREVPATPMRVFGAWTDDLPAKVAALLQPGDLVLLKASRGMALERLIPAIEDVATTGSKRAAG